MKLNKLVLSVLLGMSVSTSVVFAQSAAPESVDFDVLIAESGLTPEALAAKLIVQYPESAALIVEAIIAAHPDDIEAIVTQAMMTAPEQAGDIARVAIDAGLSNQVVTTVALQAGIDPTVAQQSPAFGEEPSAEPAPVKKFPGAEPTKPVKESPVSGN